MEICGRRMSRKAKPGRRFGQGFNYSYTFLFSWFGLGLDSDLDSGLYLDLDLYFGHVPGLVTRLTLGFVPELGFVLWLGLVFWFCTWTRDLAYFPPTKWTSNWFCVFTLTVWLLETSIFTGDLRVVLLLATLQAHLKPYAFRTLFPCARLAFTMLSACIYIHHLLDRVSQWPPFYITYNGVNKYTLYTPTEPQTRHNIYQNKTK